MSRFVIANAVWAPVEHEIAGDMGTVVKINFKAKFRRLKTSETREMFAKIGERKLSDAQVLEQVLVDWDDFKDAQGEAVPFTRDNLAEAVEEVNGLEAAMARAFFERVVSIKKDDVTKNS